MAFTWDGVTLVSPTSWAEEPATSPSVKRTASSTLRITRLPATKDRYKLTWELLTWTESEAIKTKFDSTTATTISIPITGGPISFSAVGIPNSWKRSSHPGGTNKVRLALTVEVV